MSFHYMGPNAGTHLLYYIFAHPHPRPHPHTQSVRLDPTVAGEDINILVEVAVEIEIISYQIT